MIYGKNVCSQDIYVLKKEKKVKILSTFYALRKTKNCLHVFFLSLFIHRQNKRFVILGQKFRSVAFETANLENFFQAFLLFGSLYLVRTRYETKVFASLMKTTTPIIAIPIKSRQYF